MSKFFLTAMATLSAAICVIAPAAFAQQPKVELRQDDHVAMIGNTLADRMQHDGWLETRIQAVFPDHELVFRNLGYPGDELKTRPRADNFGSADQWLSKVEADVIFAFFGYNEALKGESNLPQFEQDLTEVIDGMLAQQYNGESAPRIVFFSPIAHENLHSPHLPDGSKNNRNLELYTATMRNVCQSKGIPFVDLFHPTLAAYATADIPLTMNGIHLQPNGNRAMADFIVRDLFGSAANVDKEPEEWERLRQAVVDKNYEWFSRYRVIDEYNVFGGRSKLEWFGQSNADVMMREMEIFDVKTANRDERVWAVARGSDLKVVDNNLPEEMVVQTNKPGELEGGKHRYLSPEGTLESFTLFEGLEANVFASEAMFPELVNPVQMAVDTDGRLFASVWPSYPHWNPTQPRRDRIICLPDEDGDGVADECKIFADELNSVTGFEFWGGGMLVAAPPEIWFLKDTDGDDVADVKIRMLQGVSSADTHHSANAVVIAPDGGMYWSRGIFNVAAMETPTQTYRSTASGVHRFDPRTFEMSFFFPIGPNPHGHAIDQWGYQFVNDGTSGTGSFVNIGKGQGNKQWFKKEWRPVSATGFLSSSHFPDEMQGNFLICNCIGFLGVLQHEVQRNGADITATAIDPILRSDDPNFRPTDIEIGGDGALYVSDWSNVLIGHMQHNMRDPNRDHEHGRIFRITAQGRPLVERVRLKGKPIAEVCSAFFAKENSTRYRARLELSGRDSEDVQREVGAFAAQLDPQDPDQAQALLECLWTFEEHRVPNTDLLARVFTAGEPLVRAAAIRTLGHWGENVSEWQPLLMAAARDDAALVRAEAVKAAVSFAGLPAAEVIFEAASRPTDPELETVLKYAQGQLNADQIVQDAVKSGTPVSVAAQSFMLRNASVADLLKLEPGEAVYDAILQRRGVPVDALRTSLNGIAKFRNQTGLSLLLTMITERDANEEDVSGLAMLLAETPAAELQSAVTTLESLALEAQSSDAREAGYAAWITANGGADDAFLAASTNKERLRDFLNAVPQVANPELRESLYDKVRPLIRQLPGNLGSEPGGGAFAQSGIHVDYFYPSVDNVARETLEKMSPQASGIVPQIVMDVPQLQQRDQFALRFSGTIQIPQSGRYTFFIASDDGSRVYIGDKEVINNDGLHGMSEKKGNIRLTAGPHQILVTYFDNGGGDGLSVNWEGPGFTKQPIAAESLSVSGGETIHDIAIRSLTAIPGHEAEKVRDFLAVIKAGRNRSAAITALRTIPVDSYPKGTVRPLIDNMVGYLSDIPAAYRTGGPATEAMELSKSLLPRLPDAQQKEMLERLQNLDVRVIAIGTVPERMIYDKEVIAVQAGKPVEFRFSNSDHMPHNFAIVQPGAMQEVGELAEATARDPDAMARHYIPKSDKILLASKLLQPNETQALSYEAPSEPGVYPYVCTYPGHWRRMFGAMYVVEDLDAYRADPAQYLADNPLPVEDQLLTMMSRNHEWVFAELESGINPLSHGRNFEVGKQLFKVANCVGCHKLDGEGQVFGPDLVKLDEKKQSPEYILRSMLDPSKDIDEKFQSYTFLMDTGKVLTGMIVKETDDEIHIVIDPLAKGNATVLKKSEIDDQSKSTVSIMPKGLLNRLTQEEVFDLVAFVFAKGNKDHMLFKSHHNH